MSETLNNSLSCSFCGQKDYEVKLFFTSKKQLNLSKEKPYICNFCVSKCQLKVKQINTNTVVKAKKIDLIPSALKNHLDKYVESQDLAKDRLSVTICNYLKTLEYNRSNPSSPLARENLLIHGNSGCGKTLMIETLCKHLKIPYVIINSTTLSQTGYVGQDVEEYMNLLYPQIINNYPTASQEEVLRNYPAIVVFEEICKLRKKNNERTDGSSGVSQGVSIQNLLLRHLEGSEMNFTINQGFGRGHGKTIRADTSSILFIGVGAFTGLDKIISENTGQKINSFGLNNSGENLRKKHNTLYGQKAKIMDFIKYGFADEFIGRFENIAHVEKLSEKSLKNILKRFIFPNLKKRLAINNLNLAYEDDFLTYIANVASANKKTGARALKNIINQVINPYLSANIKKDDIKRTLTIKMISHNDGDIILPEVTASENTKKVEQKIKNKTEINQSL